MQLLRRECLLCATHMECLLRCQGRYRAAHFTDQITVLSEDNFAQQHRADMGGSQDWSSEFASCSETGPLTKTY